MGHPSHVRSSPKSTLHRACCQIRFQRPSSDAGFSDRSAPAGRLTLGTRCGLLALAGGAVLLLLTFRSAGNKFPSRIEPRSAPMDRVTSSLSISSTFEPNVRQAGPGVQLVGRGKGMAVFLDADGLAFVLPDNASQERAFTSGAVRLQLAQASGGSKGWKKIPPSESSNHRGRRRRLDSSIR